MRLFRSRPPKVDKLGRREDVAGLLRALSYEDPVVNRGGQRIDLGVGVRLDAIAALSSHSGAEVEAGLLRALEDPEEEVRAAAIGALRDRGGAAAVAPLASVVALWSEPAQQRARALAVDALVSLADGGAAALVARLIAEREAPLEEITDAPALRSVIAATGADGIRAAIEELVDRLADPVFAPRATAMLAWLAPESVDELIEVLRRHPERRGAALALGASHDARAVEALGRLLLSDADAPARAAAAWALGEIRHPAAVEALLTAAADADYAVRTQAADSFDALGNAAIAVAVGSLARQRDDDEAQPVLSDPLPGGSRELMRAGSVALPPAEPERPPKRRLLGFRARE